MKKVCRLAVVFLTIAAARTPVGASESDEGFLVRFNAGLDVIDIGLAAGIGAGYRFPGPAGIGEITADIFYGPYWETYTEGGNTFDYSETLVIVAVRANWLFNFTAGKTGWYQVAVPILIFLGEYGEAAAIAIPITAGVLFRPK